MILTNAEEKEPGISLVFPSERENLRNIDLTSILDDVAKIGCWIHLAENISEDKEIHLSAQLSLIQNQKQNSDHLLIPLLLRDTKKVSKWKYGAYLSDGLSAAARVTHSRCFINMFYWPLGVLDLNEVKSERLLRELYFAPEEMERVAQSGGFCISFITQGECVSRKNGIAAKFTVVFLEISEQENVLLPRENKSIKNEKEQKQEPRNSPQPFFSRLSSRLNGVLVPFVAVTLTKSTSNSIHSQENLRKMEMQVSGVWFINHWNILRGQFNAEPLCENSSPKPTSSEKASCYSDVMSKNKKNRSTSKIRFRFKSPNDQRRPVTITSTLKGFLNSIVVNETWEYKQSWRGVGSWSSKKLRIAIKQSVPETGGFQDFRLLWIWTRSKTYKFITSDSVYKMKSTLQIYTTPFQKEVWILLLVSLVITVAVIMILPLVKNPKETLKISNIWKILSELSLWILRILLDQVDQEFPPGIQIHQNFIKKGVKRAIRLILGVWLLMSLILVNGYLGIIKSDYTLDFPFASNPTWYSSMDFLEDGSFFVYYTQMDWGCRDETVKFEKSLFNLTYSMSSHDIQKPSYLGSRILNRRNSLIHKCNSLCGRESTNLPFEKSGCQEFESCQQLYKLELLWTRQNVTCAEELAQLVTGKLRHPKTVFMTTAQEFPYFWNQFKQKMKQHPELSMKFVHNGEENDEAVQEIRGFSVDLVFSRVNPHDADFILSPLKILLSSGIWWWWEKWEKIEFHKDRQIWRNSSEFIDESLPEFKPLSFRDSDIHLVFFIWLLFLILPATAFLFEIVLIDKICSRMWFVFKQKQEMIRFGRKERKPKVVQNLVITFPFWLTEETSPNPTLTHQFKLVTRRVLAALAVVRKSKNLKEIHETDDA